ncbi:MAG: hypothetical protein QOF70_5830 [Acetobacteraceae bacterium]|jgi:hypothetical protein|nr:hypothetical protein [Acetobacteraceae bacterium]
MLSDEKRADLLAQAGPILAVTLFEATGKRWVYVPQADPTFGILSRSADGMKIGMMPGWFEQAARFEFSPFIRIKGIAHTPQSLGLVPSGGPSLRIHATMTRGPEAVAADLLRRLVGPYETLFREIRARAGQASEARDAQRRVADTIAGLTGAAQERRGDDINLWPDVGGLALPSRVSPGGAIELGRTAVTPEQVSAIVAGLRRADKLRPGRRGV